MSGYLNRQAWQFLPISLDLLTPFRMKRNAMAKPEIHKQALPKGGYHFAAGRVTVVTCNKREAAPWCPPGKDCYSAATTPPPVVTATGRDSGGRLLPCTSGETPTDASRVNLVPGKGCFRTLAVIPALSARSLTAGPGPARRSPSPRSPRPRRSAGAGRSPRPPARPAVTHPSLRLPRRPMAAAVGAAGRRRSPVRARRSPPAAASAPRPAEAAPSGAEAPSAGSREERRGRREAGEGRAPGGGRASPGAGGRAGRASRCQPVPPLGVGRRAGQGSAAQPRSETGPPLGPAQPPPCPALPGGSRASGAVGRCRRLCADTPPQVKACGGSAGRFRAAGFHRRHRRPPPPFCGGSGRPDRPPCRPEGRPRRPPAPPPPRSPRRAAPPPRGGS